jgi:hypothetical protein
MRYTISLLLMMCALSFVAPNPAQAALVHFKGTLTSVQPTGTVDAITQYLSVGDTFSGKFEYNPAAAGTPQAVINNVGTITQYNTALTGLFNLTFTSGASSGYSINGVQPGLSNLTISNGYLFSSQGPVRDTASGVLWHYPNEFRPGLRQRNLTYNFTTLETANMITSGGLAGWSADQTFARWDDINSPHSFQTNALDFNSTVTNFAQRTSFVFTEFTSTNPTGATVAVVPVVAGTTSASMLGGQNSASAGGLSLNFASGLESAGTLQASYSASNYTTFANDFGNTAGFALVNFPASSSGIQLWEIGYSGQLAQTQLVTLNFRYDDTNLSVPETELGIWHFGKYGPGGEREWKFLTGNIDAANNIITVSVDHFSPFALGIQAVPEPSTYALGSLAVLGIVMLSRRRKQPLISQ